MGKQKTEKQHIETLESALVAMQDKIEQQIPVFRNEPLAQTIIVGTGEEIRRQNPFVSEFRALIKDYSLTIKSYRELAGDGVKTEVDQLTNLREKFRVVK